MFLIFLIIGYINENALMIGIALVFSLMSGYFIFDSGIEWVTGTNTTFNANISDTTATLTTIVDESVKTSLDTRWSNSIALIFFIIVLYLSAVIMSKNNE